MNQTPKRTVKSRILNILFWSVISAAFIGPGTVTTATKAGHTFQFELLWTLVFATIACLVLQEASARATIYSGMNLGAAIKYHFEGKKSKTPVLVLITGAIILGCAAYETGNILGSIEGLALVFPKFGQNILSTLGYTLEESETILENNPNLGKQSMVIIFGLIAALALSLKSLRSMATFIGSFVFIMGIAFITTAYYAEPPIGEVLKGAFVPKIPSGSGAGLLVLGLIGTTIVPYDLFLGSNVVQKDTTIKDMRVGISTSVILGGIISMAILIVGTELTRGMSEVARENAEFSYRLLQDTLMIHIGKWAVYIFGFGMFAAGFSSAITSPLASALTAKSIFGKNNSLNNSDKDDSKFDKFRIVSFVVLMIGLILGFMQIQPVPAIIIAQAFNGLILPFVSIFLLWVVNDRSIMGSEHLNGKISNILMVLVVWVTLMMGFVNVIKASASMFEFVFNPDTLFIIASLLGLIVTAIVSYRIYQKRKKDF